MKKLKLPSFSKLMDNNRFLTVISVLSAILAWFFVTTTIDPNQAITVDDIPLHVDVAGTSAAANHLNIIEGADQKISIRVEGKRYRIATLTPDDFVVSVNMADVNEAGEYNLPLTVSKRISMIWILRLSLIRNPFFYRLTALRARSLRLKRLRTVLSRQKVISKKGRL